LKEKLQLFSPNNDLEFGQSEIKNSWLEIFVVEAVLIQASLYEAEAD